MAKLNFLLGKGERLTEQVRVAGGGPDKAHPYTFPEAKERLQPMLQKVVSELYKIPAEAFPDDYAVATVTLNPEYTAKSYFPMELLRTVGLEAVGSRARKITPEKKSKGRIPEEAITTELFVIGKRPAFQKWANELSKWTELTQSEKQIIEIEDISFPIASHKIKNAGSNSQNLVYEIVLHLNEDISEKTYLNKFKLYLENIGIKTNFERRFYAGGLCFIELEAPTELLERIAQFSLVRVMRAMPTLRLLRPTVRTVGIDKSMNITLPTSNPIDTKIKAVIFDGGIPSDHPITKWATPMELPGMASAEPELLEHGVGVTSAYLFGHIDPKKPVAKPYSYVDHYRVLDNVPGQNPYELYEVLERINNVLKSNDYQFVNLSIGPCLPIEDDEVHAWTAVLDEHFSKGTTLATIAVGNDGEGDPSINANRIQVPADCVNALAIGACDVPDTNWQRALYSSIGPGRSPGIIKPDLVDFGGSISRPFLTLDALDGFKLAPTGGTSFSAPSVLRIGAGVRAHFGTSLNALAIRTLLIHCSESSNISSLEIGWGRVARSLEDIVICDDTVMRVVYQGTISASKYIRAYIPLPSAGLKGMVEVKATLCYATQVDPHHPGNYTRSGLELFFRPNKNVKTINKETLEKSVHAKTKSFFGKSQKAQTEEELRRDAWKWENCLHAEAKFRGSSLVEPVFDIHYNARLDGHNDTRSQEIKYAMVITVKAPKIFDLYDQVVRRYATQLEPLQPVIDIPLQIK